VQAKLKFRRISKMHNVIEAGVPAEAIPTYCALTDYANNKTGLCWPKMETLAKTIGRQLGPSRGTYTCSKSLAL
jgi:Helix-turn-helix domain